MPFLETSLLAIFRTLENDRELAEALLFPEFSRFGAKRKRLRESVRLNAERLVEELPAVLVHQRQLAGPVEVRTVELDVEPAKRAPAWREPVRVRFHALVWDHGGHARVAYVPALAIAVIAPTPDEMPERLERHVRAHLLRTKATASLDRLVWLQRERAVEVAPVAMSPVLRTPKQIAKDDSREKPRPVIGEVGRVLSAMVLGEANEIDDLVARIAEPLGARRPRSVLLVGPSGVGKTAAVHELVRRRRDLGLGRAPIWATSGSRLVAGMSGFGMWQERCQRLVAEASKEKAVLYLGNLVELLDVGKSVSSSEGIASFLRPRIASGEILTIAECTPEQLARVERDDPRLVDAFLRITVDEPAPARARAILARRAASLGASPDGDWLDTLDRLHRRYATYSAQPGRPIRFLERLVADRSGDDPITRRDVTEAFSRETGLPLFLLEESVPLDLDAAREGFSRRVMGQPAAVDLVVDLLAAIKAGLTRPRRPVASLLFIGPTGVGKTEMAKALAEYLFGSRDRMARFDMSEYADPLAVTRLVGGAWSSEGLLTAKVREQPFSVVLLDEFEKADPAFFDLLLQVLGEGRLTDGAGRVADFSNSVVVMTSNLGAESFQRAPAGFRDERSAFGEIARHFEDEVRAFVRPELFNRIDRVVPFGPLDASTVGAIASREVAELVRRDGVAVRDVRLAVDPAVASHLARAGFDARYGARPLKRAVERELLVPLADALNQAPEGYALEANVGLSGEGIAVRVRAVDDPQSLVQSSSRAVLGVAWLTAELRRDAQALDACPAVLEARNEVYRLEQLERRLRVRKWQSPEDLARVGRLPVVRPVVEAIASLLERAAALEERALLGCFGRTELDEPRVRAEATGLRREWTDLLLRLYELRFRRAQTVTIAVYGDHRAHAAQLAEAYFHAARATGFAVDVAAVSLARARHAKLIPLDPKDPPAKELRADTVRFATSVPLVRERIADPAAFFAKRQQDVVGTVLEILGHFATARFEPERGLHLFVDGKSTEECVVETTALEIAGYVPPEGAGRKGGIKPGEKRRVYDAARLVAEDLALKRFFAWTPNDLPGLVAKVSEELLVASARALLVPGATAQ